MLEKLLFKRGEESQEEEEEEAMNIWTVQMDISCRRTRSTFPADKAN